MHARALFVYLACATLTFAADWPGFRGVDRTGISNETGVPLEWSAKKNIVWKTPMPGPGASSPIVVGEHVYVTCYSGYGIDLKAPGDISDLKRHLVCVNAKTGTVLWTRTEATPEGAEAKFNGTIAVHGYATHTPVADATGVYAYFGSAGAFCYTHDGERKWSVRLGNKGKLHGDGSAPSPLLFENLLIVNAANETAEAFEQGETVALDKKSGDVVWREKVGGSQSSPQLVSVDGKKELVVATVRGLWLGLDPMTGKRLWEFKAENGNPTPTVHNGVIYIFHETGRMAIKAGGRGNVTDSHKVWQSTGGTQITSPVYHDGHLYWAGGDHGFKCVDARTGRIVSNEGLTPPGGDYYASPVFVDGRIYCVSRKAVTFVLAAKPTYELLARNSIEDDDSNFNGSPAVSGGRLFIRSNKYLYCIGKP